MNTNVNLEAPVGALLLVGVCFAAVVLGVVVVHAISKRNFGRVRRTLVVAALGVAGYLAAMLAFSLSSAEMVLARGEEKHFCELDCHLAYSVVRVKRAESLGTTAAKRGEFYIVTVRTRFDEKTISSGRGDAPLTPNPRTLAVLDERGERYEPSEEGRLALERAEGGAGTPLMTPLRPGESYTTELVFDLPRAAQATTLLLNESILPTRFVIGHENSLMHKQTKFRLD